MTGNAVTVLVATRNRPNDLRRCLQSILVSSYPSFRLMVVDQSDNDDALRACAAITDGRLEYVRDRGTGLSRARNVGIGAITSGIIAMTDDDCVVATDWLERLVALFRDNAECMLVFGNFVAAPHDWRREFIPSAVFDRPATHSGRHYRFLDHGCGGNMAARRELFTQLGGFDERLGAGAQFHAGEDHDMKYRACAAGLTTMALPSARVEHWGARSLLNGDAQRLQRHTQIGRGARAAQALRCGDFGAAPAFAKDLGRCFLSGARNLRVHGRPTGAARIPYALWGFARGMFAPLDKALCVFIA